jgi:NNP family nitrate/nitrite transporter-like MFS transporter
MIDPKGTPTAGLTGATLGFFVGFAAVALFGPSAKLLQAIMNLSPFMVGLLVAMPNLSGSLLRIPFSAWVDSTGGRKPFLVLLALSILGMLGLFVVVYFRYPDGMTSDLYPLLLILGLFCGCGIATFSVGISQVAYWYPQARQGTALGVYAGVGNLAPGFFSFLLPVALAQLDLAGSYLVWLVFLVCGTGLYFVLGRNAWYFQFRAAGTGAEQARQRAAACGQQIFPAGSTKQSLLIASRIWKTWALVGIYFTTFGGFIALTAWLPTYWSSLFGVSAVAAGTLTALYSILTSLCRVFGGGLADRLGGERTLILSLTTMFVGALTLTFGASIGVCVLGEVVLALGMGVANAAVFKLVPQEVPKAVGGAAGLVGGLGAFGGFAIPPVMGIIADRLGQGGYATGFVIFAVLALGSLGLALLLCRARTHLLVTATLSQSEASHAAR